MVSCTRGGLLSARGKSRCVFFWCRREREAQAGEENWT